MSVCLMFDNAGLSDDLSSVVKCEAVSLISTCTPRGKYQCCTASLISMAQVGIHMSHKVEGLKQIY